MGKFYLGTSGYNYKDWKGIFYPKGVPPKDWLAFYAQSYNTVEINATFYGSFPRHIFERWRDNTPPDFCFALKGSKFVTHRKKLVDIEDDLARFWESTAGIQPKLGVVLWQFAPSFKYDPDLLIGFLARLPVSIRQVIEFRHESWFREETYRLLDQYRAGFVISDTSHFPTREVVTGGLVYIRYHGPEKLYASSYTDEQLSQWADKIAAYLTEHDVYAYFNNDYDGRALRDSVRLREMVAARLG